VATDVLAFLEVRKRGTAASFIEDWDGWQFVPNLEKRLPISQENDDTVLT
jgi:hypothetical protein